MFVNVQVYLYIVLCAPIRVWVTVLEHNMFLSLSGCDKNTTEEMIIWKEKKN